LSYTYLVIPHLRVLNANAQPVSWLIGPPPVTAYAGFAHALARAIGAGRHQGVGIVHHDIQFLGEVDFHNLYPHQFRAASFIDKDDYASSNKHALSAQPTARCHLSVSLAVRFDVDAAPDTGQVGAFLRGARLAGGTIVEHGFFPDRKGCVFEDENDVSVIRGAIGSGFGLHERADLMAMQPGDRDLLDTLLRVTRPDKKTIEDRSWVQPTTVGYAQITSAIKRRNARDDLPHAFAEPLIGLVQFRSLRGTDADLPFWRYTYPHPDVFVISTNTDHTH
jgi:CRISPR-associated protein Csy2